MTLFRDAGPALAVFDVDETLIYCKSMFSFLQFCLVETLGEAAGGKLHIELLDQLETAKQSLPREEVNRTFYRFFNGWRLPELQSLGLAWFNEHVDGLFIPETLRHFRDHQGMGSETVLLSGSADFILAPIQRYLAADHLISICLQHSSDLVSNGEIEGIQTIGNGKAEALRLFIASKSRAPSVIAGYGDHESDLPFLRLCDEVHIVTPAGIEPPWAHGLDMVGYCHASTAGALKGGAPQVRA